MARFLLLTILLVCLFCMFQASPMPQEAQEGTAHNIEEQLSNAWNDMRNTLNQGFNKDKINEFVENGREWLNRAVDTVRTEAEKIIPKSS